MLDIFVGTQSKPLKVQKSVLHNSSECFAKAIKHQRLGKAPARTLHFSEDSLDAWKIFLWWKIRGALPLQGKILMYYDDDKLKTFVKAWVLGDKYNIPALQDALMVEILIWMDFADFPPEVAKLAFQQTMPGSPLRVLAAEEIAYQLRECSLAPETLSIFDGSVGFAAETVSNLNKFDEVQTNGTARAFYHSRSKYRWADFMVGGVPFSTGTTRLITSMKN